MQSRWRSDFKFAAHDGSMACLPLWRASLVFLVVAPCLELGRMVFCRLALCGGSFRMPLASPLRRHGGALAADGPHRLCTTLLCKQMFVARLIPTVAEFLDSAEAKKVVETFDDDTELDARLAAQWPHLERWISSRLPERDPRELGLSLAVVLLRPCETPPDPAFFDTLKQPAQAFIPLPAGEPEFFDCLAQLALAFGVSWRREVESSKDRSWTGLWPKAGTFLSNKIKPSLKTVLRLLAIREKAYASGPDNALRGVSDILVSQFALDRSVTPGAVKYLYWQRIDNWDPARGSLYYLLNCCVFGPPTKQDRAQRHLPARHRTLQANKFTQSRLFALWKDEFQLKCGIFAIKGCCLNCGLTDSGREWRPFHKTEFFQIEHGKVRCARCKSSEILILGGPRIYSASPSSIPDQIVLRRCCSNENCRLYMTPDVAKAMEPWSQCPRKGCNGRSKISTKNSKPFYWRCG